MCSLHHLKSLFLHSICIIFKSGQDKIQAKEYIYIYTYVIDMHNKQVKVIFELQLQVKVKVSIDDLILFSLVTLVHDIISELLHERELIRLD
jgi:hypothetical protein